MIELGNKEHGDAIARAVPRNYNPAVDPVISRSKDGKLLGGVIYEGYTGSCIFAHQAAFDKRWLSRDMLWMLFHYPFIQLKCKKLCGTIPSGNTALLAFNAKLGFKVEHVIEDGYPDGGMMILSMKRDECRWLDIKQRTFEGASE